MNPSSLIQVLKLAKADGANSQCIISATDQGMLCTATSPCESLITFVASQDTFDIRNQLGIRDIDRLIKILQLHGDEVDIKLHRNKLNIEDSKVKTEYAVANADYINSKELTSEPDIDGEIILDSDTINQCLRAMKVLSDSRSVGILMGSDMSTIIVGDSDSFSNKISFNVPSKVGDSSEIYDIFYLNLQFVKQVLDTNSNCTDAKLLIDTGGIVKFTFKYETMSVNYYLLMLENG